MSDDNVTILGPNGQPTKMAPREAQMRLYRLIVDSCNHYTGSNELNPIETIGILQMVAMDIHMSVVQGAAVAAMKKARESTENKGDE